MPSIHILSQTIQNQIAAGEVVERPASVVKELVENAIDAKATHVHVLIEQGGTKEIRIIDNGIGMDEEDLKISFIRYSTSKIQTIDDLFSLSSFGFRGEAIAAIASVSNMIMRSKQENAPHGYECINGKLPTICACPKGTETIVQNLFWNVPARKKFLKSIETEYREIVKTMEFFAMSHPHIAFSFSHNGKEVFHYAIPQGNDIFLQRVQMVLGSSISSQLLSIEYNGNPIYLRGFCSHPSLHRASKEKQFFFVNGRMITKDSLFSASIQQAYHSLLPQGKYPAVVLSLDVPAETVDVNVHPRKQEVKFHAPNEIFQILKNAITHTLSSHIFLHNNTNEIASQDHYNKTVSFSHFSNTAPILKGRSPLSYQSHSHNTPSFSQESSSQKVSFFSEALPSPYTFHTESEWKIIGQSRNSFIIVEEKNGIRVVDQHAAHERVRYEHYMQHLQNKQIIAQPLLTPIILSISLSEKSLLLEHTEYIQSIGFEIEDFGGNEIAILSVPMGSEDIDIEKMFSSLLADLDFFDPSMAKELQKPYQKIVSYMACRGAKKFGDALSIAEMHALINDWKKCQHPDACAHGRRVSVLYPFTEIENECGRY